LKAAFALVFYLIKQSIVGHFVDLKSDGLPAQLLQFIRFFRGCLMEL
jgi:hypothetical protein